MTSASQINFSQQNYLIYQELLVQIEASIGIFSLLIAVCDDRDLQKTLIKEYEQELASSANFYQVKLDNQEPSIKAAITTRHLESKIPSVITVIGANNLSFVRNKEQKSEQDKFFGYLQWTREGLREFKCPIILWINTQILVNISRKAPDFWSWRKSVFKFESESKLVDNPPSSIAVQYLSHETVNHSFLSLEDLQELIASIELKRGKKDPSLVTLYNSLGRIYFNRLTTGIAENYIDEQEKVSSCFRKAISLSREFYLQFDLIDGLIGLGDLLHYQGNYQQAIDCFKQSLKIATEISNQKNIATSFMRLGIAYRLQGKYQQAIDCQHKSLEIVQKTDDLKNIACALNNLGNSYYARGEYQKAIDYYQQSLEIKQEIDDNQGIASCLNNLGNVYNSLEEYQQAIDYYQQSLEIRQEIDDLQGIASCLNNLGSVHDSLGEYQQAIDYYQQSLEITRKIGDRHRELGNWLNLGNTYKNLQQKKKAKKAYENVKRLCQAMKLDRDIEKCDQAIQHLEENDIESG